MGKSSSYFSCFIVYIKDYRSASISICWSEQMYVDAHAQRHSFFFFYSIFYFHYYSALFYSQHLFGRRVIYRQQQDEMLIYKGTPRNIVIKINGKFFEKMSVFFIYRLLYICVMIRGMYTINRPL